MLRGLESHARKPVSPEIFRFSRLLYFRAMPVKPRERGVSEPVDIPNGTPIIALRRQCLLDIGLFDERYFVYGDELELGLRARRRNWLVCVIWGAIVGNPGTGSSGRVRSYLFARNSLLLVRTQAGWKWATLRLLLMLTNTLRIVAIPRSGDPSDVGARLSGIRDFLLGRFGPPPHSLR